MKTKFAALGIITVWMLSVLASAAFAGPTDSQSTDTDNSKEAPPIEKSWCETPKPFEIRAYVPGWLAGVSGDSGVKGVVSSTDVSFDQLLRHLTHVRSLWELIFVTSGGSFFEMVYTRNWVLQSPYLACFLPPPTSILRPRWSRPWLVIA